MGGVTTEPEAPDRPTIDPPEWPKEEPSAADLIRYFVGQGQFCLGLMRGMEDRGAFDPDSPLMLRYMHTVGRMQHACDVAMLLKDPTAEAKDIWLMAESGDCYGEALWEWACDADLDPDAIHAAGVAAAKALG